MNHFTAEESKRNCVAVMGEELGAQYSELWQEVVYLYRNWLQYVALFGTKPSRIELLNKAAPGFFRMIQDVLWEETLLHIARLTDPPRTGKDKRNLTIQSLPRLVADPKLQDDLDTLIENLLRLSKFCRDWRNRRIAHRDLSLALDEPATRLKNGSRQQVDELLKMLAAAMNLVSAHYLDTESHFRIDGEIGGAMELLYVLHYGTAAEEARQKRLQNGKPVDGDFDNPDL